MGREAAGIALDLLVEAARGDAGDQERPSAYRPKIVWGKGMDNMCPSHGVIYSLISGFHPPPRRLKPAATLLSSVKP
jgi:hypothetical protein